MLEIKIIAHLAYTLGERDNSSAHWCGLTTPLNQRTFSTMFSVGCPKLTYSSDNRRGVRHLLWVIWPLPAWNGRHT